MIKLQYKKVEEKERKMQDKLSKKMRQNRKRKQQKKGRHFKKEKKSKKISKIRVILTILLIMSVIYLIIYFWNSKNEQKEQEVLLDNVQIEENKIETISNNKNDNENVQKVKNIKEQYQNIVAWIEINGTNINYPVMHGTDNDYYMTHNYKGEQSKSGALFLDKDYNWQIPSSNLLIYGHNNKDGIMFSELLKYKDENFYKENPTIKFITTEEEAEYEIISAFLSRVYYKSEKDVFRYYYFVNAQNEEEYNYYVTNVKKEALYDTGKNAKFGDQLMTLTTCEYSQKDGRFVVVAKKKTN